MVNTGPPLATPYTLSVANPNYTDVSLGVRCARFPGSCNAVPFSHGKREPMTCCTRSVAESSTPACQPAPTPWWSGSARSTRPLVRHSSCAPCPALCHQPTLAWSCHATWVHMCSHYLCMSCCSVQCTAPLAAHSMAACAWQVWSAAQCWRCQEALLPPWGRATALQLQAQAS